MFLLDPFSVCMSSVDVGVLEARGAEHVFHMCVLIELMIISLIGFLNKKSTLGRGSAVKEAGPVLPSRFSHTRHRL